VEVTRGKFVEVGFDALQGHVVLVVRFVQLFELLGLQIPLALGAFPLSPVSFVVFPSVRLRGELEVGRNFVVDGTHLVIRRRLAHH